MPRNPGTLPVQRLGTAGMSILASANPLEVLMAGVEYMRIRDQEETKRLEIRARVQLALETLRTERELMNRYFDTVFSERRRHLARLHDYVEKAIAARDSETLVAA